MGPLFPDVPPPPRDMMEALQQRMDRYKAAAAQAKSKGDDRKARMHERIVKVGVPFGSRKSLLSVLSLLSFSF